MIYFLALIHGHSLWEYKDNVVQNPLMEGSVCVREQEETKYRKMLYSAA
jgi:hypothetical protein